jgi:uncharacterized protein
MSLTDTGIIVAAADEDDSSHSASIAALRVVRTRLITTWPCITEAMYLLGRVGAQSVLQKQIEQGIYSLLELTQEDAVRACTLMRQYADSPMDFADASLVVAAENLGATKILTLDSHFYAYRINGTTPFEVSPARL